MSLNQAIETGKQFATLGWSEEQIGDWLVANGYKVNGNTAARIRRAYIDQLNRG